MAPTRTKRLTPLEDENGRLRKLVADLALDKERLRGTSFAGSSAC